LTNPELVTESQKLLAASYLRDSKGQVGNQSPDKWKTYGEFMYNNGLLTDADGKKVASEPNWGDYYTNAYLPASSQ